MKLTCANIQISKSKNQVRTVCCRWVPITEFNIIWTALLKHYLIKQLPLLLTVHLTMSKLSQSNSKNTCFYCDGSGIKKKRERNEMGKMASFQRECKACAGTGYIQRTNRAKRKNRKAYPNYVAPGPHPVGAKNDPDLLEKEDEELCFLTGNWKIFQKIGRHRYSTDDIVTAWLAHSYGKYLGYTGGPSTGGTVEDTNINVPTILDIGCGLGSVLLCSAWLWPNSPCVGVEAQKDRYEQAGRSIRFNVGAFPSEQQRVNILHSDMRDMQKRCLPCEESDANGGRSYMKDVFLVEDMRANDSTKPGFDIITGTPPYFVPQSKAQPPCLESAGCLFELRGGVEVYCSTASQFLRPPCSSHSTTKEFVHRHPKENLPSIFVMVNTSLSSSRVYKACHSYGLSVVKRLDGIPKAGKESLFSVFVMVLDSWIEKCPQFFPELVPWPEEYYSSASSIETSTMQEQGCRVQGSVRGEEIQELCVRTGNEDGNQHTVEYQLLLNSMGMPSTADK